MLSGMWSKRVGSLAWPVLVALLVVATLAGAATAERAGQARSEMRLAVSARATRSAAAFSAARAAPAATPIPSGSFVGTCGKDATGAKPCQVSFTLSDAGKRITDFRFEPPSCLVNNNTVTTTPVQSGDSFGFVITYNGGSPKFAILGKILSATKATVTLKASCQGKTTTRSMTLTKRGP